MIEQEVSQERWIPIPEQVREIYTQWRPTPMYRAYGLEKALDTPAHIYYKYEGVSPAGSHKPNTAVAQAFYNKEEGVKRISTETGAGQWGSALSYACQLFGVGCEVYMVRISYDQKPYRKLMMNTWGAEVIPSPSDRPKRGGRFSPKTPTRREASALQFPKPWSVPQPTPTRSTHWVACSIMCSRTRPSWGKKRSNKWRKRASFPTS